MSDFYRGKFFLISVTTVLILFLAWFGIGIEQVSGEFKEDTRYVFFIKKHISTKVFFVDPTNCNAGCDTPSLSHLNEKELKQFSDYCFYRYDLFSEEDCYNFLYEKDD